MMTLGLGPADNMLHLIYIMLHLIYIQCKFYFLGEREVKGLKFERFQTQGVPQVTVSDSGSPVVSGFRLRESRR